MKAPAFQFYPDSFLLGTALFSCEEAGAYIRLLCYQWDAGHLPNDNDKLANLARCGGNAVASIRHKFRICEDGHLRNDRLEKERQKQADYRAKQSENAAKRWVGNAKPHAVAMPTHMPNVCSPSPSPSPINKKKGRAAVAAPASDAEWLASLKENPAYDGLNIGVIYGKMQAWCGANKRQPTRRRFINWLNREEKPMPRAVQIPAINRPQQEPENWQAKLKAIMPDSEYTGSYSTLPDSIKAQILEAK